MRLVEFLPLLPSYHPECDHQDRPHNIDEDIAIGAPILMVEMLMLNANVS